MTEFIKTVAQIDQLPKHNLPEIALVGRSNSGKSSLLNSLVQQKKMAYVSSKPGKTRHLNFFNVNKKYVLVDLPGYGFAKKSIKERSYWKHLIEEYISKRDQLVGIILIVDCRRSWTKDEVMIVDWVESLKKKGIVALTKVDKLNQKQKAKQLKEFQTHCNWNFYWVSNTSKDKSGILDLKKAYCQAWVN